MRRSGEARGAFPPNTLFVLKSVADTFTAPAGFEVRQRLYTVSATYATPKALEFHRKQQGHSSPRAVTEQQREFVPWQQKYQALIAQRKAEREIAARLNKGHVAPRAYGREWR